MTEKTEEAQKKAKGDAYRKKLKARRGGKELVIKRTDDEIEQFKAGLEETKSGKQITEAVNQAKKRIVRAGSQRQLPLSLLPHHELLRVLLH